MYLIVLSLSLLLGILFSEYVIVLAPYATLFLATIFFFSALKIDLKDVVRYSGRMRTIALVTFLTLILLPIVVFCVASAIVPDLAIALAILAAMPSGMTAPLLSEIAGGKQSFALVITIITSLLAPFSVPLIIKLLTGTSIEVSAISMFYSLALVIFTPFALANLIKPFARNLIHKTEHYFKPISIILLGLLITGIVSKQAGAIREAFLGGGQAINDLVALFILFIAFHVIAYTIFAKHEYSERITITVNLAYVNFTLAIFLVDKFFTDPGIIVPVVLSVLPWSTLLIPFKYLVKQRQSSLVVANNRPR